MISRFSGGSTGLLLAIPVIVLLAFAIRWSDLDRFATIDESRWIQRGADFWTNVQKRDAEGTFLIGHPGVTTMWLVGLGMGPDAVEQMATRPGRPDVTRREGYLTDLVNARHSFVLLASGLVGLLTLLVARVAGNGIGILSGLMIAADPFLAAHSQVAHLDSALTGFMSVAFISALAFVRRGGWQFLVISGMATGLAILTKAPSVFLLASIPLVLLSGVFSRSDETLAARITRLVSSGLLWGLLAAIVAFGLWPALRSNPLGTAQKLLAFASRVGGGEHDNFFLGQPIDDPGWFYYPVVLAYRLGVGTMLGLISLVFFGRFLPAARQYVLPLVLYCVGFWLMMSLGPKQFDRYMLPVFPMLVILAAAGLWSIAMRFESGRPLVIGIGLLALVLQAGPLLAVRPYQLAYYNPLLGGGPVAQRMVFVGWGEGLAPVAAYLNAQPIVFGAPTVASSYHRALQAHLEGSAVPIDRLSFGDYVVPYVNTLQRGLEPDVVNPLVAGESPEFVVWHNGVEYARVYRGPHYPGSIALDRAWGDLKLVEALVTPGQGPVRPQDTIQVLLRWQGSAQPPEGTATVRLVDRNSGLVALSPRRVGEDGRGGSLAGTEDRWAEMHTITVPTRLVPGDYRLDVLLESRSGGQGNLQLDLRDLQVEAAPR